MLYRQYRSHKQDQSTLGVCFTGGGGKKNFYFNSYGLPPTNWNSHWAPFMSYIRSNGDFQQETSNVCRDYCMYVLKKLCSMPTPD